MLIDMLNAAVPYQPSMLVGIVAAGCYEGERRRW